MCWLGCKGDALNCAALCEWESRARDCRYRIQKWPLLSDVAHTVLEEKSKIYLPPLHIKIGLIKVSVKVMDKERKRFGRLRQKFSATSEAKMKAGIFVGPHTTQPFEHQDFSTELNSSERRTWKVFENVCRIFPGNEKAEHYSEIMQQLISSYSAVGCDVSLKLHVLHYNLDFSHWRHGSHPGWTWWKVLSGYFPNCKGVQCKVESKCDGWLLLESDMGETNWRK